jgi:hypothetical protein
MKEDEKLIVYGMLSIILIIGTYLIWGYFYPI